MLAAATLLAVAAPLRAQSLVAQRDVELRGEPRGGALGTLRGGATVRRQEARAGYTRVIVEGFVEGRLLGGRKGKYPLSVKAAAATLRAAPSADAAVTAELPGGVGLALVSRGAAWVKVRRGAWVASAAFSRDNAAAPAGRPVAVAPPTATPPQSAPAPAPTAAVATAASTVAGPVPEGTLVSGKPVELRQSPDGGSLATIKPGAALTPLARERGWVRVRVEGWVPESGVVPADTALRTGLSAADLRADPLGTRGRVVRWDVEVISFHTADPLRRDLTADEPYLLARGPARENALLYLALPPSLVAQARALPPLGAIIVTARVRTGRSDPIGVPVLDVMSLSRR
ncbi:MAG: hypothetical protein HYX65_06105 [Gemmatimonadetes bacterium]|nr:hypothetical protein [Gemmatimonadota bacterium]